MSQSEYQRIWDHYSGTHSSVTAVCQIELWEETIQYLSGDVADFGCGSARIAPLITDKPNVISYTGIDASSEMVSAARVMTKLWKASNIIIERSKIETYKKSQFSSALSLNSYYAWADTCAVLENVFSLLKYDSKFILATPSPLLDMTRLVEESRKILWAHPHFDEFSRINLNLVNDVNFHAVEMDVLLSEIQQVGFSIVSCHQKHYLGGMNFVVAQKHAKD